MPAEGSGAVADGGAGAARRVLDAVTSRRSPVRREAGREVPAGRKAARTRAQLLAAAYQAFAAHGYQATAVADIAAGAGVSLGTFYQYFRDRADIMATLVATSAAEMLDGVRGRWRVSSGRIGLRRMLAAFVRNYAATAAFQAVWEEVTHVEAGLAQLRRDLTRVFTEAIEAELRRGAEAGLVRDDLDPAAVARALAAMVDRTCYTTFVFDPPGEGPAPVDEVTDLLTALWADAIGLVEVAGRPRDATNAEAG